MPAVLPIAEIMVLVVALLIIFAATLLFKGLLQSMVSRVPVVGHFFGAVIGVILQDTQAWVIAQIEHTLSGIWGLIMSPVHWIASIFERIALQLYNLAYTLSHLANAVLPALRAEVINLINQEIAAAETYALTLDQQLYQDLTGALAQVYAYISTQVTGLDNYIISEIRGVDGYVQSQIATVTAYLQAEDAQLLTYVQQGLAADQAYADALYNSAISYAQSAVISLDGTITADLTGLQDWVSSQVTALQAYITAALAGVYAYVDTSVAVVATDLANLKTECVDNLCQNLTPLANLLGDLAAGFDIAAIIALAAEFATDPAGAAADVQSGLGSIVSGTVAVVRDAVGV